MISKQLLETLSWTVSLINLIEFSLPFSQEDRAQNLLVYSYIFFISLLNHKPKVVARLVAIHNSILIPLLG